MALRQVLSNITTKKLKLKSGTNNNKFSSDKLLKYHWFKVLCLDRRLTK